jgi:biotin carboxyl carrier protein
VRLLDPRRIEVDGKTYSYDRGKIENGTFRIILGNSVFKISMLESVKGDSDNLIKISVNGVQYEVKIEDRRALIRKKLLPVRGPYSGLQEIRAPMPGKVTRLEVQNGDNVSPGMGLLVLEAMKMENEIKSHLSGVVERLTATVGQPVEKGEILLSIRPS